MCEKFFENQESSGTFILGISLYLLHANTAMSSKHVFTNFEIRLIFTKTKL